MSTNYRTSRVDIITGSVAVGKGTSYPNVWGIMKGHNNVSGSVSLKDGGSLNFDYLEKHQILPCYATSVTVTSGEIVVLS
jgi:hypothetical protein